MLSGCTGNALQNAQITTSLHVGMGLMSLYDKAVTAPVKNASCDVSGPVTWSNVQVRCPWLVAMPMLVEDMICKLPAQSEVISSNARLVRALRKI